VPVLPQQWHSSRLQQRLRQRAEAQRLVPLPHGALTEGRPHRRRHRCIRGHEHDTAGLTVQTVAQVQGPVGRVEQLLVVLVLARRCDKTWRRFAARVSVADHACGLEERVQAKGAVRLRQHLHALAEVPADLHCQVAFALQQRLRFQRCGSMHAGQVKRLH
jgi:hypothetical protein